MRTTVTALTDLEWMIGQYDEYDRDDPASGVFGKAQMKAFMKTAIDNMTPKQRSVYLRFYAEGKTVAEIAGEDNCNISAVYRHLSKADEKIFKFKELFRNICGNSGSIFRFFDILGKLTLGQKRLASDYYIKCLTLQEIARDQDKNINNIWQAMQDIKTVFYRNGLTSADLKCIRKINRTQTQGEIEWIQ